MVYERSNLLPTTLSIDIQRLYEVDVNSEEFKQLLVNIAKDINRILISVNSKVSGAYSTNEIATGKTFFPNPSLSSSTSQTPTTRQILSKVVTIGALPASATTKQVAHGIDFGNNFLLISCNGGATNAAKTSVIPLNYSSPVLAENISVYADATNVYIKTGQDRSTYTDCYVILEYIKG